MAAPEAVTALLVPLQRVDASNISVQEGTPSVSVVLASADSLAAAIQEASAALLAALNRADAFDLSLAEAASLIASLARNDELTAAISESTAIIVTLSRSEGLGISAGEGAAGLTVLVGASDVANLSASEIESLLIALLRADVLAAAFGETSQVDQSSQQHILAPVARRMIIVPDRMLKVSKEYRVWVVPPEDRSVKA